jgi:hypothetical protein
MIDDILRRDCPVGLITLRTHFAYDQLAYKLTEATVLERGKVGF